MHPVLFHLGSILIPSYGVVTALGVLAALFLAQRTARLCGVDPAAVWNLCVLAVFAGLIAERLALIAANWSAVGKHPAWALDLAMVHHPLLTCAGVGAGGAVAAAYVRLRRLPVFGTADALAAPLALAAGFEQLGALLAGAGFGTEAGAKLPWAVTYNSLLAARWSGTPLFVPLHPVQAYAALGFFTLAIFLYIWLPVRGQAGDAAGICLMGLGAVIFITELWRDPAGRGVVFHGALDLPQIAGVLLVFAGAFVLRERRARAHSSPVSPQNGRTPAEATERRSA